MLPDDVLLEADTRDPPLEADTRDLLLEAGTRLLHIGPHKTGTTAVQGAFRLARERLAAQGVVYRASVRGVLAATGQPPMRGEARPDMAHWHELVREVSKAGDQRVLVSSEFFAHADDAAACRIIEDLGGPRVHVLVTLRPLTKIMPSQWQQYLQNGLRAPYLEWLDGMLRNPPYTKPTPTFWMRHRHDELVARWARAAGPQNLTVLVVDESDRLMLLRTLESLLGLPVGFLVPDQQKANRSLTVAEAEVVRLLNGEFKRRKWPGSSYAWFMRYGAVRQMKTARQPLPGEPRIVSPAWALERAAQIGAEMAENILALGVRVIGDISVLGKPPAGLAEGSPAARSAAPPIPAGSAAPPIPAETAAPPIPAEAAAQAVVGALIASGIAGQAARADKRQAVADRLVGEVDTKSLAGVLVRRGRRWARRTLPLRSWDVRPRAVRDSPPANPGSPADR